MSDYADDVPAVAEHLPEMPAVVGWSMGGLVAIMVAARGRARACVGLAYARSDLFDRRRRLMNAWAAYLSEERGVVSFRWCDCSPPLSCCSGACPKDSHCWWIRIWGGDHFRAEL